MNYMFLRYPGGKPKAVTLSYDDGPKDDIQLVKIFNKYDMKCTFNYTQTPDLTDEEVETLLFQHGHEIAVHTMDHSAPGCLTPAMGLAKVYEGRKALEQHYGRIIRGMAYPDSGIRKIHNGTSWEEIRSYVKTIGIVYARTLGADNNSFMLPQDWYAWMPTAKHLNPNLFQYVDEFLALDVEKEYKADRYPRLFYLWGHSFEFPRDNNWNVIEEFCQKMSHRDDIWYATNIEIYDYVNAYNRLEISVDGTILHNPTLVTLWFAINGVLYSIAPDETLVVER